MADEQQSKTAVLDSTEADPRLSGLRRLREPFAPAQIEKLPRDGELLDYVGHAGVTNRLLDADLEWEWEPMALDEDGLPLFVRNAVDAPVGLWIALTVCGVTRLGYGSVVAGSSDPEKELIGDAIRNAAMRFGVALDLWAKCDLHDVEADAGERRERPAGHHAGVDATAMASPTEGWKLLPRVMQEAGLARKDMLTLLDGDFSAGGLAAYLEADPSRTLGTLISAARARKEAR